MLASLLVPVFVLASPLLNPGASFPVKKELKDPAPAPKLPADFVAEMQMDFESYDVNDASGQPLMSTHTDQRMKMRRLPKLDPKDPASPKDGYDDRVELVFERLVNASKVRVPGLNRPFETKSDLGAILAPKPLVIRTDAKGNKKVDDLDKIRNDALAQVTDTTSRASLSTLLSEGILLKAGAAAGQDSSCLAALEKKKPGDKWKFSREEQGVKLEYNCEFEGWAEAHGKKVVVVGIRADKQRTVRQQPNGVPGVAETEGEGKIYFEPGGQESLMRMETKITVEPAEEELNRLKAWGQTIPRNRSVMTHWNHNFPL